MSFGEEEKIMNRLRVLEVLYPLTWLSVDEAAARIRDFAGDGRPLVRRWMRKKAVAQRRRIHRRKHGY